MTSSDRPDFRQRVLDLGRAGEALVATVDQDRLSPSYLFEGADPERVREAATAFSGIVLTAGLSGPARERALEQMARGVHPDFHVRERDKATVISVAALSETLERAHALPASGSRQVFLIDPAEAMEAEGVARYLKALEEPPAATVFVLATTRAERLPETVLSRVRRIRIPPLTPDGIRARLEAEGVLDGRATSVARWAGGSLSRARRLAGSSLPEAVEAVLDEARRPVPSAARTSEGILQGLRRDAAQASAAGEAEAEERADPKRERLRELLQDLLLALGAEARDAAAGRVGGRLEGVPPDRALRLLEDLGRLSSAVSSNVTPSVVVLELIRRTGTLWQGEAHPSGGGS